MSNKENKGKVKTAFLVALVRMMPLWISLALIVAGIMLFLPVFGEPLIKLNTTDENAGSDLLLAEIQDVYRLNTVEYVYKVVFPYDFDVPGVSGPQVLKKLQANLLADPKKVLSHDQQTWLQVVGISRRNGLKIYDPDYQFLVVTVIVKAGFDLKGTGLDQASVDAETKGKFISVSTSKVDGKTVKRAVVTLPPVAITDIEIEDPVRDQYPFPSVGLAPQGWKEIAGFISDYGSAKSLEDGILEKAKENVHGFIRELLASADIDDVLFK